MNIVIQGNGGAVVKTMLIRRVNDRVRYYLVELFENLFGEWMVIRTYGSIKAQSPTGVIREYYTSANEAELSVKKIIRQKEHKGYQNQSNNEGEL